MCERSEKDPEDLPRGKGGKRAGKIARGTRITRVKKVRGKNIGYKQLTEEERCEERGVKSGGRTKGVRRVKCESKVFYAIIPERGSDGYRKLVYTCDPVRERI